MLKMMSRYFWWTEQRGNLHYDVMVTAILAFIFITPHYIDYKATPVTTAATHASEVLVREAGTRGNSSRFQYEIRAEDLNGASTDAEKRAAILRVVEPIAGEVSLEKYEPLMDKNGVVIAYNAWVLR
jgi:hypothetical protein